MLSGESRIKGFNLVVAALGRIQQGQIPWMAATERWLGPRVFSEIASLNLWAFIGWKAVTSSGSQLPWPILGKPCDLEEDATVR
jgi:hypothetical protein